LYDSLVDAADSVLGRMRSAALMSASGSNPRCTL
jgi:hypothetical protein